MNSFIPPQGLAHQRLHGANGVKRERGSITLSGTQNLQKLQCQRHYSAARDHANKTVHVLVLHKATAQQLAVVVQHPREAISRPHLKQNMLDHVVHPLGRFLLVQRVAGDCTAQEKVPG